MINCLACLIDLAIPLLKTSVCNLLSNMLLTFNPRMSTKGAFPGNNPSFCTRSESCFLSLSDCAVSRPTNFFVWVRKFLNLDRIFQISCLFFRPYSLLRTFSSLILSACHGCEGPRNFALVFLGSPILTFLSRLLTLNS